jgi:hypothetical protein
MKPRKRHWKTKRTKRMKMATTRMTRMTKMMRMRMKTPKGQLTAPRKMHLMETRVTMRPDLLIQMMKVMQKGNMLSGHLGEDF